MQRLFNNNRNWEYGERLPCEIAELFSKTAVSAARQSFATFFTNLETPLIALPGLARKLGVGELYVKDESSRCGLQSFKALGGAYAVLWVVQEEASRRLRRMISHRDLISADVRAVAQDIVVCCATDGNHGRSVAMGASLVGCRAVIYLHAGVSPSRERAIQTFGAETIRIEGGYDRSVAHAAAEAVARGWTLVTDTSWPGNEVIPAVVMRGYAVMAAEISDRIARPTHVFLQAGVGSFAASIAGYYAARFPDWRPRFIVAEPRRAACLFQSNLVGTRVASQSDLPTIMAMLECHEPSHMAWQILARLADFFLTVDEDDAAVAMRQLAFPIPGDPVIVSGESGCVGLAAMQAVIEGGYQDAIGLNANSRVLIINTEGATDPDIYEAIVGTSARTTGR